MPALEPHCPLRFPLPYACPWTVLSSHCLALLKSRRACFVQPPQLGLCRFLTAGLCVLLVHTPWRSHLHGASMRLTWSLLKAVPSRLLHMRLQGKFPVYICLANCLLSSPTFRVQKLELNTSAGEKTAPHTSTSISRRFHHKTTNY